MAPKNAQAEGLWPEPCALAGVKSRKRHFFKADKVTVASESSTWSASGLTVCLDSRIAAVGDGARTVVKLLLEAITEESGTASRHESLIVAHLGPQLAGKEADADAHMDAVQVALQGRPQVVVIQEALSNGGAGWARAYRKIIRDPALASFKGAVIVDCEHEVTFAVKHICNEQWVTSQDRVTQQDTSGRFKIFEDALSLVSAEPDVPAKKGRSKNKGSGDNSVDVIIEEVRAISEFEFEEDVVRLARKHSWTLAVLAEEIDGCASLRGYLCYKYVPAADGGSELYIERLAVPKKFRGRGFARVLMKWLTGEAARIPLSDCPAVTCSAFDTVIKFYEGFGLKVCPERQVARKEDEDPQTFMAIPNDSLIVC